VSTDLDDPYDGEYWLNTRFAKKEDYDRFMEWRREILLRRRHHAVPPPTAEDYLTMIRNTIFTDAVGLSTLIGTLNNEAHPYIPIGTYKRTVYRLAPSTAALKLFKKDLNQTDTRDRCPSSILGLNKNTSTFQTVKAYTCMGPPPKRRLTRSYTPSSHNISSTGNDSTGFTFMQLGTVKSAREDEWTANKRLGNCPIVLH
jgi:hypothetical protein